MLIKRYAYKKHVLQQSLSVWPLITKEYQTPSFKYLLTNKVVFKDCTLVLLLITYYCTIVLSCWELFADLPAKEIQIDIQVFGALSLSPLYDQAML